MKNNYVFIFEYGRHWMVSCYKNGRDDEYFNSAENYFDKALKYVDLLLENGGNKYYYVLPDYETVENIDIFTLKDEPIKELEQYLDVKKSIIRNMKGENMNSIKAAKTLMSHLEEITDESYKMATEMAIESLLLNAVEDWRKADTNLSVIEYLGITDKEYVYWLSGLGKVLPTMQYQEKSVKSTDEMLSDIQELKRSGDDTFWFRLNEDAHIFVEIVSLEGGDILKIILSVRDTHTGKVLDSFNCDYDDDVEIKNALGHLKGYVLG